MRTLIDIILMIIMIYLLSQIALLPSEVESISHKPTLQIEKSKEQKRQEEEDDEILFMMMSTGLL